ncbi:putative ammonium transporter 3 isoform X2 [Hydractinia symbiolongicarpus]|nr:putative ammonium transporter 3 isoform X2 [Hydractinia symbiolongicarpus]
MSNSTEKLCSCNDERIKQIVADALNSSEAGDATWILTSAFIIFTMQSGFGLLEAGSCSIKNESNIMMKNAIDVLFGALGYWLCGFGLSFGQSEYTNAFTGIGAFLTDSTDQDMGHLFAKYFFQLSFATTATTIVSGAMAERTNLKAYMLFSFLNMFSYVFPAHWIWDDKGFLHALGAQDVAGCGPVHLIGGTAAFVATLVLKPRYHRFDEKEAQDYEHSSPMNIILGLFMLWWGWLGFNCGSTFGVSGGKWKLASRAAVVTVNGSVGGGLFVIFYCYILTNKFNRKLDVGIFATGILAGLVSITGICAICRPWEALLIGFIGGAIACYGCTLLEYLKIDDPVSCVPVHGFAAIWGLISVGFFAEKDIFDNLNESEGLFKGGGPNLLGYQLLSIVCYCTWAAITTFVELYIADKVFGLRISLEQELIGSDFSEHGISVIAKESSEVDKNGDHSYETTTNVQHSIKALKKNMLLRSCSNAFSRRNQLVKKENVRIYPEEQQENEKPTFSIHNKYKEKNYWKAGVVNFGYMTIADGRKENQNCPENYISNHTPVSKNNDDVIPFANSENTTMES